MKKVGLYIHVPFCSQKCPYCDFYSISGNNLQMDRYLSEVIKRFKKYSNENIEIDTVYLGGGTPSLLGTNRLNVLLEAIHKSFNVSIDAEFTIEVNPNSASILDFVSLKNNGLNRVSIGMQSAVNEELKLLGRHHTPDDVLYIVNKIYDADIDNISLDIMIGVPYQTEKEIQTSINFCRQVGAKHISAYILKFEKGTSFYNKKDKMPIKTDDEQAEQYLFTANYIESIGYQQYEISNFSLKEYQSRHNNKYWRCKEYIGIGPSAHSFYKGERFYYDRDFQKFYDDKIILDGKGGDEQEFLMLNLRLTRGLIFSEFEAKYRKINHSFHEKCKILQKAGYLVVEDDRVFLTKKGFLLSNQVITELELAL